MEGHDKKAIWFALRLKKEKLSCNGRDERTGCKEVDDALLLKIPYMYKERRCCFNSACKISKKNPKRQKCKLHKIKVSDRFLLLKSFAIRQTLLDQMD